MCPEAFKHGLGSDTVWLSRKEERKIIWSTMLNGSRIVRWTSGELFMASPEITLGRIDPDSIPDLFVTLDYEEMVSGVLLLGNVEGGSRQAFVSRADQTCLPPQLLDVNGDGLLDIVQYSPGAVSAEECRGDAAAAVCVKAYPVAWESVLIQDRRRGFLQDDPRANPFYQTLARKYHQAAGALRRSIESGIGPAAQSTRCNEEMVELLDQMGTRAQHIADGPS